MKHVPAALACLLLTACDTGQPGTDGGRAAAPASPARGELLSFACQACHSFGAGGPHQVGPNLYGVFGRPAGTAPGFEQYSEALLGAGFVWTETQLDRWLADPANFLPGTSMAFTGYRDAADRAALIAYLVQVTGSESPTDAAAAPGAAP